MELPIYIYRKFRPCTDHLFDVLHPKAKGFSGYCKKCGWKLLGGGWYLPPVKFENRWWFDH